MAVRGVPRLQQHGAGAAVPGGGGEGELRGADGEDAGRGPRQV